MYLIRILLLGFLTFGMFASITAQSSSDECPESQFTEPGMYGVVTPGDSNNVRAEPSVNGEVIGQLTSRDAFAVLPDGIVCADGYLWREIETFTQRGWTVEIPVDGNEPFIVPFVPESHEVGEVAEDGSIIVETDGIAFTVPAGLGVTSVIREPMMGWRGMGERPNALTFTFEYEEEDRFPVTLEIFRYLLPDGSYEFPQSEELEMLLTDQPPLLEYAADERMPQAPLAGAAALIGGAGTYLPFGSGEGLRYITVFAQDSVLFDPEMTFRYVYRGISDDGGFLITAQYFPVHVPANAIPDASDAILYTDDYVPYLREFEANLASQPTDAFTPELALLDAIFTSLTVTDPEVLSLAIP